MIIRLVAIVKTDSAALAGLISEYAKRLSHYIRFDLEVIPDIRNAKNLSQAEQKDREGTLLLSKVNPGERLLLLDERGKHYSSVEFAALLQKNMNSGIKALVFFIGGPYGFSQEVYDRADGKISLSTMTFSHQMVRLFFVEQLYRGFTILRNEPYHHE